MQTDSVKTVRKIQLKGIGHPQYLKYLLIILKKKINLEKSKSGGKLFRQPNSIHHVLIKKKLFKSHLRCVRSGKLW